MTVGLWSLAFWSLVVRHAYGDPVSHHHVPANGIRVAVPGTSRAVTKWLGLQYALPPARWQPSTIASFSTQNRLDVAGCEGAARNDWIESGECLHLNIYAPERTKDSTSSEKAVMVFFHGGSFQRGSPSAPAYDASSLAANQDVIVVAPSYRTSFFGFTGEFELISPINRNVGLHDQRIALEWVKEHISRFGGDPNKVTIFGQGAGGRGVDFHLLTMKNPPFRAAIIQSGGAELTPMADYRLVSKSLGNAFLNLAKSVHCVQQLSMELYTSIDCLRVKPVDEMVKRIKQDRRYFTVADDGGLRTVNSSTVARKSGINSNIPVLIGTNAYEQASLVDPSEELPRFLETWFPRPARDNIREAYNVKYNLTHEAGLQRIVAIETAMTRTCPTSRETGIAAESGYRVWRYLFNGSFPNSQRYHGFGGSFHGAELPFVFGNLASSTPEQQKLSMLMQKTWADFAKDPERGPGWASLAKTEGDRVFGYLGASGTLETGKTVELDRHCEIFKSLYEGRA